MRAWCDGRSDMCFCRQWIPPHLTLHVGDKSLHRTQQPVCSYHHHTLPTGVSASKRTTGARHIGHSPLLPATSCAHPPHSTR
jgi:hypothetical protein